MRLISLFAGAVTAIASAIVWAALTAATSFQIGYMAVGVGFAVAYAVRFFGDSSDKRLAYASATLSLIGCLLGNYLAAVTVAAQHMHGNAFQMSIDNIDRIFPILGATFSPIDLLFYGMGIYFGYKYALVPRKAVPPPQPVPASEA